MLRELYRQKNHPFGLKGAERVQNEESFRCPYTYKQEIEETTQLQMQATFHRKGKRMQSVEVKAQEMALRAMESYSQTLNSNQGITSLCPMNFRSGMK